jgi:hypothetical protein
MGVIISVIGIATFYGLDGPVIEFLWGRDFLHPFIQTLGPTQPPISWITGLFLRSKADEGWH